MRVTRSMIEDAVSSGVLDDQQGPWTLPRSCLVVIPLNSSLIAENSYRHISASR